MTLSRHSITLNAHDGLIEGVRLGLIRGTLTLDERRSPYMTATFEVVKPTDEDTLALLTPRGGQLHGTAYVEYRDPISMADITAYVGAPVTMAKMTTKMGGGFASTTAALSAWGNDTGIPSATLPFRVFIDSITPNPETETLTITASGQETRLQEFKYFGAGDSYGAAANLTTVVFSILNQALPSASLRTIGIPPFVTEPVSWQGGVSAWDFLDSVLQPAGYTLQYLPTGIWQLAPANVITGSSVDLDRVTGYDLVQSREDWAQVVLVSYTWTDPIGGPQVRADIATAGGPGPFQKVMVVEHKTPYPGPGAAQIILDRAQRQGVSVEIEAVSNYAIRPGLAFYSTPPDEIASEGRITAVSFEWPANRMRIRTQS